MLERWVTFLEQQPTLVALSPLLAETDPAFVARLTEELTKKLINVAAERRERMTRDAVSRSLATTEVLRFCAADRHIAIDAAQQVTRWPDRAAISEDATPATDARGPMMATEMIHGHARPVFRFDGEAVLQSPRTVPPVGTLFAVYRPNPSGGAGTRLIGWEDSEVGQHGIGLMPNAEGGLHAIVRRAGSSGDVVAPAPARSDF